MMSISANKIKCAINIINFQKIILQSDIKDDTIFNKATRCASSRRVNVAFKCCPTLILIATTLTANDGVESINEVTSGIG
jgi:hypothetical protein